MSFLVYVNMQKRGDGKVYCDMHKTDHHIYFTAEECQAAINADPVLAPYRHVVPIICNVAGDEMTQLKDGHNATRTNHE